MSQAEFINGTICLILCALKVGVRVLRMRFHSSPWATVSILSRGSGNLSSTCQRKTEGNNNLLKGDDEAQGVREHGNVPKLAVNKTRIGFRIRGPFLESPETFRAHFGWHNPVFIFKPEASRGTKLSSYFNFYSLYNISQTQLYRISGLEFYEWLFGSVKFSIS